MKVDPRRGSKKDPVTPLLPRFLNKIRQDMQPFRKGTGGSDRSIPCRKLDKIVEHITLCRTIRRDHRMQLMDIACIFFVARVLLINKSKQSASRMHNGTGVARVSIHADFLRKNNGRLTAAAKERSNMVTGKKIAVLAGLGLAALFGIDQSAGWAGIPVGGDPDSRKAAITEISNQAPVVLARGGGRGGNGGGGNCSGGSGWNGGDNSKSRNTYGAQDGTGSAPRPQDGTGYGAKNGSGSGDSDSSGSKGQGGKNQTN